MGKDSTRIPILIAFVVAGNLLAYGTDWLVTRLGGGSNERLAIKIAIVVIIVVFAVVATNRFRKSQSDKPPED